MNPTLAQKFTITLIWFLINQLSAQINPDFFPKFEAYAQNPIIKYGDGFTGAAWNDPTVLKIGNQYIMYASASIGISGTEKVKIYRQISDDGYHWTLSPEIPVLEPKQGSYYAGGTETPSVIYKNGTFHMYLTTYAQDNIAQDFTIAHATSPDGLLWTMDANPILESDGSATWHGSIVGEPGALVYHDSIYVYFSGAGIDHSVGIQCIGLMKSADGAHFGTAQKAVELPRTVYPASEQYVGLSTPSALAINDTIYLFTDVAQTINGTWTQVALHQFKTWSTSGIWYHDQQPIHTKEDFSWTDGDLYSELRSITPLLDTDNTLRIWYAGNHLADIAHGDTTYHLTFDNQGRMHADPNFWGIGTSKYQFSAVTAVNDAEAITSYVWVYPNPCKSMLSISSAMLSFEYYLYNSQGQEVMHGTTHQDNNLNINTSHLPEGIYNIQFKGHDWYDSKQVVIEK